MFRRSAIVNSPAQNTRSTRSVYRGVHQHVPFSHREPLDHMRIPRNIHWDSPQPDIIHGKTTWYELRTWIKQNPDVIPPATVQTLSIRKSHQLEELLTISAMVSVCMPDLVARVPYLDLVSRSTDAGLQCSGCQEHMQQSQNSGTAHSLTNGYLTFTPDSQISSDVARCMVLAESRVYLRRDFLKHIKSCQYACEMFSRHCGSPSA